MKKMTHENNFITASWNVRESTSEDDSGRIEILIKPEFHKRLAKYKRDIEKSFNGGKACKGQSNKEFWSWKPYGASSRVESEIIEFIEREFVCYSEETEWLEILMGKHEVNGYSIRFNESWKEFQTYHSEIGSTEGFKSYKEAVEYCEKG